MAFFFFFEQLSVKAFYEVPKNSAKGMTYNVKKEAPILELYFYNSEGLMLLKNKILRGSSNILRGCSQMHIYEIRRLTRRRKKNPNQSCQAKSVDIHYPKIQKLPILVWLVVTLKISHST